MPPDAAAPRISIIIPAYDSHATIAACLDAIERQSWRDFETIVVDSSPTEETASIVRERFPSVRLLRNPTRLYPQGARNQGFAAAKGSLIVFTDSDVYARADWLAHLVVAEEMGATVVVGALDCYGSRTLHRGMHLCKFSKWLPYGSRRNVDMSPTSNMLIRREAFTGAGGFTREGFIGDVTLSRAVLAAGTPLVFEPQAIVEHHHHHTLRAFLRERFARGRIFGSVRAEWLRSRRRTLGYLVASVLPVRLFSGVVLMARHAARGGRMRQWIAAFPIAILGHLAWLAGESVAYEEALRGKSGEPL